MGPLEGAKLLAELSSGLHTVIEQVLSALAGASQLVVLRVYLARLLG